jgi:hypothetical protein
VLQWRQRRLRHPGIEIDFMDAQPDGAAEIRVTDAGAAVEHQRQAGLLANRVQASKVELRFPLYLPWALPMATASASMPVRSTKSRALAGSVNQASSA